MPPEVLDTPVEQEAPSLRESLEAAIEATPIEAPAPDRDVPAERTPARKPDGKFAPKEKAPEGSEFPSAGEVKEASQPVPAAEEPHEDDPATVFSTDNAPKSWKASTRQKWVGVDPEVRAEVHRREREMTKALNDAAPVKKFTEQFTQVIQPHAQRYAQSGMTPLQVVHNLMQADATLSSAPMPERAKFMAKLIADYQIDIQALDAALSGGDPASEPFSRVESIIDQKLAPLQEFVQSTQQSRQAAIQREYQTQEQRIDAMMKDDQNFPHMSIVALDMADIMEVAAKRQLYLSPEEAYKRAVVMNPEAQAAEQGRAGQQRAHVAHDAATRSLGASLSVSGSPAGLKQSVAPDDLRGTIEAAWQAAQGR